MTKKTSKPSFKDQLRLASEEACLAAIKNGLIAGLVSIGLTLLVSLIATFSGSDDATLNYFADPSVFIDIVLMAIMVFFIYKKSRTAASCMFLYFVFSKYIQWTDLGEIQGLPMTLIFTFLYFNAMRSTFIWHAKYKAPSPAEAQI